MIARTRRFVLVLLIASVWFATADAFTLCVHADYVGFEPSWSSCCEADTCCETALPQSEHSHVSNRDGCRDVTPTLGDDWAPDDSRRVLPAPALAPSSASPPLLAVSKRAPDVYGGVPPPVRADRAPILRC